MTIRLILADDHPIVLDGLSHLFEQETDMRVVACCSDGEATLQAVREHRPDILVLDLNMPRVDGMDVLRRLAREGLGVRTVLLTADIGEDDLIEAVRLGVHGIVLKEMASDLLVRCVRTVHGGGHWLERQAMGRVLEQILDQEVARAQLNDLTPREIELILLANEGLRNREIAARLGIAEGTVKVHLHRIYEKLGVTSRVELLNYARKHGIV